MTLLNAPAYDERRENLHRNLIIGTAVAIFLAIVLCLAGFMLGHGWFFSNLPTEHRVNTFFEALEVKDYAKAYGIYYNDPKWEQHPQQYSGYPLKRFTEDWTTDSPVHAPITSHHVDISKTDGSGLLGTGIIVAVRVNLEKGIETPPGEEPNKRPGHKIFMYVTKSDGTMTWPAPHELGYN
jgi:hypothetical protein